MPGSRRPLRRGVALTKEETAEYGPVQIIVIGFENPDLRGEIFAELDRLRKLEVTRLVDLVVVAKDTDGELTQVQVSDLTVEQAAELGAIAGALIGFGAAGEDGAAAGASWAPRRQPRAACSARGVVGGRRGPAGVHGRGGAARAPLGDPAARLRPAGWRGRAGRRLDPP